VPLYDSRTTKSHFLKLRNKMTNVFDNWILSCNGDGMMIERDIENTKSAEPVSTAMLSTNGGERLDFLGSTNPSVMYLWHQLLANGLWNYGKSQLPPSLAADGGNAPNVMQEDKLDTGRPSMRANKTQHRVDLLEQANLEMNAVLSTIATSLETDSTIRESAIQFQNNTKILALLDKKINTTKVHISLLNDQLHKFEESRPGYLEKLADIEDSGKTQPRREELYHANITEIRKSSDDIKQQIQEENKALEILCKRHKAKECVIDGLNQPSTSGKADGNTTPKASDSGSKRRKRPAGTAVASVSTVRRCLMDNESHHSNGSDNIHNNNVENIVDNNADNTDGLFQASGII